MVGRLLSQSNILDQEPSEPHDRLDCYQTYQHKVAVEELHCCLLLEGSLNGFESGNLSLEGG